MKNVIECTVLSRLGQGGSRGVEWLDHWIGALQDRYARASPCPEFAPNGKVSLMGVSAARSGQIVVRTSHLFAFGLC
jgi:hypothetical protein